MKGKMSTTENHGGQWSTILVAVISCATALKKTVLFHV